MRRHGSSQTLFLKKTEKLEFSKKKNNVFRALKNKSFRTIFFIKISIKLLLWIWKLALSNTDFFENSNFSHFFSNKVWEQPPRFELRRRVVFENFCQRNVYKCFISYHVIFNLSKSSNTVYRGQNFIKIRKSMSCLYYWNYFGSSAQINGSRWSSFGSKGWLYVKMSENYCKILEVGKNVRKILFRRSEKMSEKGP